MRLRLLRSVAVGLVAPLALVGCSGDDDDVSSPSTAKSPSTDESPTTVPASGDELSFGALDGVRVEVLGGPDWLVADEDFVYLRRDNGGVDRVDPETGAVIDSADADADSCQGIGLGFESVWVCNGSDVLRIALEPFEQTSVIPAQKLAGQGHLATGFDRVWVLQGDGSALAGIDPETETVDAPFALPLRGTDVAVGSDAVWIVSALDDAVVAIDPADGTIRHRIDGFDSPAMLSIRDGVVWVGDSPGVHQIDEASGTRLATVAGGLGRDGAVAADDTGVWVRKGAEVHHVAPDGTISDEFDLGVGDKSPGDMIVAFDALWTSASEGAALFRIDLTTG